MKIRGQAFHANGHTFASWTSIAEAIDENSGTLAYTYMCEKPVENISFQGVGFFQFERNDESKGPQRISGYSADLTDGKRSENREIKLSNKIIPFEQALAKAKES